MARFGRAFWWLVGVADMLWHLLRHAAYRKTSDEIWLISERGDEAQDNGYFFFKYLMDNRLRDGVYFVIRRDCPDHARVEAYPNVVDYGSTEHKRLFLHADKVISTHSEYFFPWKEFNLMYRSYKRLFGRKQKFVFLDHGIIKEDLSFGLAKEKIRADLFVTSTRRERASILEYDYGYEEDEVVLTGLPRYDWLKNEGSLNRILLMPTHRRYVVMGCKNDAEFERTAWYRFYADLIHDPGLNALLDDAGAELVFYPHYAMHRFLSCFESPAGSRVTLASKDRYSVQALLKTSRLLITDYSSIYFDFAYLRKPTIYCHFDREEYSRDHYATGWFDFERDGFGPVVHDVPGVVAKVRHYVGNGYAVEPEYLERIDGTFEFSDSNQCRRVYEAILALG